MPKRREVTTEGQPGPSLLERVDLALASQLVRGGDSSEPIANVQRVFDGVRRPSPSDAVFLGSLLRLRGFMVRDEDAKAVLEGSPGRLQPVNQEFRMIRGLATGLQMVRERAASGLPPDGWFAVKVWKEITAELPRFRNTELRRGPPWDSVIYVNYPSVDQLPYLLDTFDLAHHFRDQPMLWNGQHPVRQGFRILWRFARIAPFPDFNMVMGWMLMVGWLQMKGYPLIVPERSDQVMLTRLISGPPPMRIVQWEKRLLDAVADFQDASS